MPRQLNVMRHVGCEQKCRRGIVVELKVLEPPSVPLVKSLNAGHFLIKAPSKGAKAIDAPATLCDAGAERLVQIVAVLVGVLYNARALALVIVADARLEGIKVANNQVGYPWQGILQCGGGGGGSTSSGISSIIRGGPVQSIGTSVGTDSEMSRVPQLGKERTGRVPDGTV